MNGRDVVHGVRRDRVEEGAFLPSQGHELGHLAGALGIAPQDHILSPFFPACSIGGHGLGGFFFALSLSVVLSLGSIAA